MSLGHGKTPRSARFTSRFIPRGSPEQLQWFNDLCLRSASGEVVANLLQARAGVDISDDLAEVRAPALVLHARDDQVLPIGEGGLLASRIPGAEFVELDSSNHILLEHEPAWQRFREAVLAVAKPAAGAATPVFATLSARERQVLTLITQGLSNTAIAERLEISEKTVRNHASNIFDKLEVWSRAQAIVFARDHGFQRVT